jgi:hypothetical protein
MYVYTFVRKDIPLAQQIVQACHSSMEAGVWYIEEHHPTPNHILIEVADENALLKASSKLTQLGIDHRLFEEPDEDMGCTTFTTEPLTAERKKALSNYRLWRA